MEKTVLITGAAGALGSVVAEVFEANGWDLILVDVSDARLKVNFPNATSLAVNLTDFEATHAALANLPPVQAVLNIAGGFSMETAEAASPADLNQMFDLNLKTLFNTTTALLPNLMAQNGGFMAGISAAAGLSGGVGMATYAASKGAVAIYLKSLAAELAPKGIRVSVLYPMGALDTPGNRVAMPQANPNQWIDPYQIAQALLFLATRDRRGHIQALKIEVV